MPARLHGGKALGGCDNSGRKGALHALDVHVINWATDEFPRLAGATARQYNTAETNKATAAQDVSRAAAPSFEGEDPDWEHIADANAYPQLLGADAAWDLAVDYESSLGEFTRQPTGDDGKVTSYAAAATGGDTRSPPWPTTVSPPTMPMSFVLGGVRSAGRSQIDRAEPLPRWDEQAFYSA